MHRCPRLGQCEQDECTAETEDGAEHPLFAAESADSASSAVIDIVAQLAGDRRGHRQ